MQDLNWDEIWKRSYEERMRIEYRDPGIVYWDNRAEDFSEMRKANDYEYGKKVLGALRYIINADAEVLDIGAGPGTFVIPFAGKTKKITAVEPSREMAEMIRKNAREAGVQNFEVIEKLWQDVDIATIAGKFDLVICSLVLWIFENVWGQLQRMEQASRGHCCVVTGTPERDGAEQRLWRQIMGEVKEPDYSEHPLVYNLLYSKGRYPNVEIIEYIRERSVEKEIRQRTLVFGKYTEVTPEMEAAIRDFVTANSQGGMFRKKARAAVISWSVGEMIAGSFPISR